MIRKFCDYCGEEVTHCRYFLSLNCERGQKSCGPTMDVYIHPPISSDSVFCGLRCLAAWIPTTYNATQKHIGGTNEMVDT